MSTANDRSASPSRSKRRVIVIGIIVLLGGAAGTVWIARGLRHASDTSPKRSPVSVGVGALGRLEPGCKVFQVTGSASLEGSRVEALLVEEGDEVRAGDVLAMLDTQARRLAAVGEAKAHVMVSQANLALVRAGTKPADVEAQSAAVAHERASYLSARANFERAERLRATNALSPEEFDQRKYQLEMAQKQLRQAEATLAALKTVRPESIALAEAELVRAQAGLARADADWEASKIRSPITGRVLKVYARAGEKIGDSGLAEVGDTSRMHAVAEVHERDVPRVKVGQRAQVRVQSLPGELTGEVVQVGWKVGRRVVLDNDPVKDTDARVVEVRVKLDSASSQRVAGLTYARVEVAIDTGDR